MNLLLVIPSADKSYELCAASEPVRDSLISALSGTRYNNRRLESGFDPLRRIRFDINYVILSQDISMLSKWRMRNV